MTKVINLASFREQQMSKAYTAYYGTPITITKVKRPKLVAVKDYTEDDIAQLQGSIDMSSYMDWLVQQADIDNNDISNIIPWNNNIPW